MNHTKSVLADIYKKSPTTGELKALERLMSEEVLDAIKKDEESRLRHEKNFDQRVYVAMVWIDKIPLAKFCNLVEDCNGRKIESKVEIGDLVIQRTRSQMISTVRSSVISNQSLVVQAKVTKDTPALVPIAPSTANKVTSTTKELALLEHWPEFDLFETSRSKQAILTEIDVDASRPHSFYGAFNTVTQDWTFGRARKGEKCGLDFCELLAGLQDQSLGETVTGNGSWSELMGGVMCAASNRKIPEHINSALRGRKQSCEAKIAGFDLHGLIDFLRPKKLAILMIDQVDFEGHDIELLKSSFEGS